MPRAKKPSSPLVDPLFAAMIAKLPSSDKAWDVDKQVAWLNMMAMAFGTVYGGNAAERLACKCHDKQPAGAMVVSPALQAQFPPAPAAPQKFHRNGAANGAGDAVPEAAKPMPHPFYIDKEGYARNKKGARVLPSDVTDYIADTRGEGGMDQGVVWADDSQGWPKDRQLDVTLG